MAYLIIQSENIPDWRWGGTTATLRIYASHAFYEASTGAYVGEGNPQDVNSFCQEYACTIVGTTLTMPEITLATTVDSTTPNARYTAVLYDSADANRYTLLSNFFVDPEYLQVQSQSSVIVNAGGTPQADGIYTYRGIYDGKPYYTLQGEESNQTVSAISWNPSSEWHIYNALGTNTYYISTSNTDYPWEATFTADSGINPVPDIEEYAVLSTSNWEQLNLSNRAAATVGAPYQWNGPFWDVQQTKQYINSIVGDGDTPIATRLITGKVALSTAPTVTGFPTVITDTDARVNTKNVEEYASFTAAVDAVDALSGTNILQVSTAVEVNDDKTVPSTVILEFKNGGALEIGGFEVLVQGEIRAPAQTIFTGDISKLDVSAAYAKAWMVEWFGADADAADNYTAIQTFIDQRRGTVYGATRLELMPDAIYRHATPFSWDDSFGITVAGDATYRGSSGFRYTGTGARGHSAQSSQGLCFDGIAVEYSNVAFTGKLFEFHPVDTGDDASGLIINRCLFRGYGSAHLASDLIDLDRGINIVIRDTVFENNANIGIRGSKSDNATPGHYSNVALIENCAFMGIGFPVVNAVQNWTVANCTFEGAWYAVVNPVFGTVQIDGTGTGETRCYADSNANNSWNLTIRDCYIGDMSGITTAAYSGIRINGGFGVTISGNLIAYPPLLASGGQTTAVYLNGSNQGVTVAGNYVRGDRFMYSASGGNNGVTVSGNDIQCTTNYPAGSAIGNYVQVGNYGTQNYLSNNVEVSGGGAFTTEKGASVGMKIAARSTSLPAAAAGSMLYTVESVGGGPTGMVDGDAVLEPGTDGNRSIWFRTLTGWMLRIGTTITALNHFIFGTDNTYDIGAAGATRPRTGYFGTSIVVPTVTSTTAMTTPSLAINGGTAITTSNCTGTGNLVKDTSPTLATPTLTSPTMTAPVLGTAASGVLTACTVATAANGDSDTSIASTAFVQGAGIGAKFYQATITQSGGSAPTATVLNNTLGGTVVWARTSAGLYTATLTGVFTANKTQIFVGDSLTTVSNFSIVQSTRTSANVVTLTTRAVDLGVPSVTASDGILTETAITIVVTP